MNEEQLLTLLRHEPTEESVRVAFDWIAKQESSSKAAERVLKLAVDTTRFGPSLPLLNDWLKEAPWAALWEIPTITKSPRVISWLIDLLESNPHHRDAGKIWYILVLSCRDYEISVKARQWFVETCDASQDSDALCGLLMTDLNDPSVLQKMRLLFDQHVDEIYLLYNLLRYDDYEPAINKARAIAKGPKSNFTEGVIGALLRKDPDKYTSWVQDYMRRFGEDSGTSIHLLRWVKDKPDALLPIVSDWVRERKDPKDRDDFMDSLLTAVRSKAMGDFVWSWLQPELERGKKIYSLRLFLSRNPIEVLPDPAIKWAIEWLHKNKNDEQWVEVFSALFRIRPDDKQVLQGVNLAKHAHDRKCGPMMLAVARYSAKSSAHEKVKDWAAAFPEDDETTDILLALCDCVNPKEISKIARTQLLDESSDQVQHFPDIARSHMRNTLAILIRAGEVEHVEAAIKILNIGPTDRRSRVEHNDKGTLLLALLEKGHGDSGVLRLADSWLRLIPKQEEKDLHARLENVVRNALPQAF